MSAARMSKALRAILEDASVSAALGDDTAVSFHLKQALGYHVAPTPERERCETLDQVDALVRARGML